MNLPDAILDHRNAFVGTAGAGKTYAAKSAVEILLGRRWRVCVVDPLGVWYGLRSSADGTGPGFDVTIFGGAHGDLPLTEAAAPIIAEAIAVGQFSCIVDLSGLPSQASRRRFMKAFAETLYAKNHEPLHLVLDEADLFCPQRPIEDIAQILGARIDEIVRRGRVKGFVPWLISQRPAVIHKDVLSQVDTLVAFKLTSSQDRDALGAWIEGQADRAEQKRIYAKLPTLKQGDCIVWSPADGILQDYRFPKSRTFDSSRTPKRGERISAPTGWSKPDLEALRAKLATVEKEAEANDPKALKARIRELERQAGQPAVPTVNLDAIQKEAWADGRATGYRDGWNAGCHAMWQQIVERVTGPIGDLINAPMTNPEPPIAGIAHSGERRASTPEVAGSSPAARSILPYASTAQAEPPSRSVKTGAELRILKVLAQRHPAKLTMSQWATLSGMKKSGGTWNTYVSRLRTAGFIEQQGALFLSTHAGRAAVGHRATQPQTRDEVLDMWRQSLGGERRMFDLVVGVHPRGISREYLAERLEMTASGGTFNTYLSRLRSNGLVTVTDGMVRASDDLMGQP